MGKGDVIAWAAILGGIALMGYAGYRAIGNVFSDGGLDPASLLGVGGNAGKTDIFGNTTTAYIAKTLGEAKAAVAESDAKLANDQAKLDLYSYDPAYEILYQSYINEMKEFNDLYAGFNPTYGFWTGKEDPETQAYRQQLNQERAEAMVAYNNLTDWMARHS